MHNILIKGGMLVDGTGAPAAPMDLALDGGRIAGIYKHSEAKATVSKDASGMIVCPGFIDIHTHSDLTILGNPLAESKIRQGVTTEIVGNCGGSLAPLRGAARKDAVEDGKLLCVDVDWTTMDEYLLRLHNLRTSVNVGSLVGAETVRRCVLGDNNVKPNAAQLEQMNALVAESMSQGGFGLSSGLVYAPGYYAGTDELISLASTAASFGGIYSSHIRGEGVSLIKAVEEAIRIGREANMPVQISHHKASGNSNWGKVDQTIKMIEEARRDGVDVAFDGYPYTASNAALVSILPPWAREGNSEEIIGRLKEPGIRKRIATDLERSSEEWENTVAECGWDKVVLTSFQSSKNRRFEGKSVTEVSAEVGKTPLDTTLDLLVEEGLHLMGIYHDVSEDDLRKVLAHPLCCVASDGESTSPYGLTGGLANHPRSFGTFPRVLRKYAIDLKLFSIEEAVRKMTSLPAQRMGIRDRGVLAKGMAADVVVFDPEKIRDTATFEQPHGYPEGVKYVIVNGAVTIEDGKHTKERAGFVLRHSPRIA